MFTTGQVTEGAVNYTNSGAVCGQAVTGDNPTITGNQTNLTLPVVQACAQPIGPKWVASITNWLCYVIDGAGLGYRSGTVCQDPMLLLNAIAALISANTLHMMFSETAGDGSPGLPVPPNPDVSQGLNGQNFYDRYTGNVWGPKAAGAWPSSPAVFGNNRDVGLETGGTSTFTKSNCFIQFWNNVSTITALIMDPTDSRMANNYYLCQNLSSINHIISTPVGLIQGGPTIIGAGASTITIVPGQILLLTCDNTNWQVTGDSLNFAGMANVAVSKPSPVGGDIICFFDGSTGLLKKATIAEILTA